MAPVLKKEKRLRGSFSLGYLKQLIIDPSKPWVMMTALFILECVINIAVIWKIKCKIYIGGEGWRCSS